MREVYEVIYESDDWIVRRDKEGNLEITNFWEGHWNGALHITKDGIWEE